MKHPLKLPRRAWMLGLLPAALLLSAAGARFPAFAEGYARTVYPALSRVGNAFSSLFPFSLGEWLLYAALLAALGSLAFAAVQPARRRGERKALAARFALNAGCAASALLFAFVACCGLNYSRVPFAEVCGLTVRESSHEELRDLCAALAEEVNAARAGVREDENGLMALSQDFSAAARDAQAAFDALEEEYPTLGAGYGAPKPVLASRLMSYGRITGMFFPFTFEANVNADAPDYSIPATMCHELTHLRGYMREDEANFIAYLAARGGSSADLRYSGAMLAFVHANNALFAADAALGRETYALLCEGARRDFAANNAYWAQFEGPVGDAAEQVNDAYLKANRQEDGVESYGRMVDLLLAYFRAQEG